MSLKQEIDLLRAVIAAGFKLVNSNAVNTDDGACWEATLAFGTKKLVRVSNGGFGGDDESEFLETQKLQMTEIRAHVATFLAIPAVSDLVKDKMITAEGYNLDFKNITQEQFDAKKDEILGSPVKPTSEAVEYAVAGLASFYDTLKAIKREVKKGLCVAIDGDDAKGAWHIWKWPDTPENRAKIQANCKVDYFFADVIAGL